MESRRTLLTTTFSVTSKNHIMMHDTPSSTPGISTKYPPTYHPIIILLL